MSSKEVKRQIILNNAAEMLTLKPTATLQEIADYCNIGIATLHRYFKTREILLDALAINAIELIEEAFEGFNFREDDMRGNLKDIFDLLIPLGNKISFLSIAASVDENPQVVKRERALQEPLIRMIDQWKSIGVIKATFSSRWIISTIYSLLFLTWQEIYSGNLARNNASEQLLDTILFGFSES
ncbi:TetR/AcrR family transcriptional regulator [Alkaliphilus hydrothermalis]|uniref:AcrR family transcriptional regulator n=1 Tax=Alkaliphilus hydrothermalis TaxID=1482730 RepID=A0ABS2NNH5_9FIRM|nr:TetR/AcrR family transcriptional regulator [Alkaliphilus hydrothermalis]MBM7614497.1 AcrR family transcriptional regulator [Alkaliphilus hydrothermalis]